MSVETTGPSGSIAEMLELYSKRLGALQDELCTVSSKLAVLSSDLTGIIAATRDPVQIVTATVIPFISATAVSDTPQEAVAIYPPAAGPIEPTPAPTQDLTLIAGIDTQVAETLQGFGIETFAAVSGIDPDEATAIGTMLGEPDRIFREHWIEQAEILAAGGLTAYARFVRTDETVSIDPELAADRVSEIAATPEIGIVRPALQVIEGGKQPVEPLFESLVLEHDETTSELLQTAAGIARTMVDEAASPRQQGIESAEPRANELAAPEAPTASTSARTAEIIDLASRRTSAPRRRRPVAIAASLVVLIAAGITMTVPPERLLGLDFAAITSCGEALMSGNPSCLHLPVSSY